MSFFPSLSPSLSSFFPPSLPCPFSFFLPLPAFRCPSPHLSFTPIFFLPPHPQRIPLPSSFPSPLSTSLPTPQMIDGEAFLLLTQADIVKIMSVKLGPALKIYNAILMFKNADDTLK